MQNVLLRPLSWIHNAFLSCTLDVLGQHILLRTSVWLHHTQRPRDVEKLMPYVHGQNRSPSGDGRNGVNGWGRRKILSNSLSCKRSPKLSTASYETLSFICVGVSSFFSFLFPIFYSSISSTSPAIYSIPPSPPWQWTQNWQCFKVKWTGPGMTQTMWC